MSIGPVFATKATTSPISLSREGSVFRLAFSYREDIMKAVRSLPYAVRDPGTRSWTCVVCAQAVNTLREWFASGLVDTNVDTLLGPDEQPAPVAPAVLHASSGRRPYLVKIGISNEHNYARLSSIVGAAWDKKLQGLTYPTSAAAPLLELIDKGVIADPEHILDRPGAALVIFDSRTGGFLVRGDQRANDAFSRHFPNMDVVAAWRGRGLEVEFLDPFAEQMYAGELARTHPLPAPEGLKMELFEHQRVNFSIAVAREGHAVFDEPGLGKSASGIATGLHLLTSGQVTRVVIVAPASVRTQWAQEITRFTGHQDVAVVGSDAASRQRAYEQAFSCRWLVVHYDILSKDKSKLAPLFAGALVVADEAHRVKNREVARTKALRELSRSAARRLALTGTPVETSPEEWFEILSGWVMPGCLGSGLEFSQRYRWPNSWGGYEGARNLGELRVRSMPFYSRHTMAQVAKHMPPLRVQHMPLDPDAQYAAALRLAHADAVAEIRDQARNGLAKRAADGGDWLLDSSEVDEVERGAEMTATGLLRLLCSSPRLVQASDSASARAMMEAGLIPDEDGPKMDQLRAMAAGLKSIQDRRKEQMQVDGLTQATPEMVTGERMVVFTFSKRMANLIAERFAQDGIKHVLFTGDTSNKARDAAKAEFLDPNSDVIAFVATDAAAEGLNLGRCCNLLVNVDLAWTAARMSQRARRIHRIDGTAAHYLVVNLTVVGTLEAGFLQLLEARADLADALLGEEGGRALASGRQSGGSNRKLILAAFDAYDTSFGHLPTPARKPRGATAARQPRSSQAAPKTATAQSKGTRQLGSRAQETVAADEPQQLQLLLQ